MSRQVNYSGDFIEIVTADPEPRVAAELILRQGKIPENFVALSNASKAYRDTTLGLILLAVTEHDELVDTMCKFMRGTPTGGTTAKVMTEYAAAIAFALEHKDLAIDIITRNDPSEVTPFVWTLVGAIKKGMPGVMYQGLVTSNVHTAQLDWEQTKGLVINSI
jgi:hypothetical protein